MKNMNSKIAKYGIKWESVERCITKDGKKYHRIIKKLSLNGNNTPRIFFTFYDTNKTKKLQIYF
jgi:hypothetical protein